MLLNACVAIIDDEEGWLARIDASLREEGIPCVGFRSFRPLMRALKCGDYFDIFVVDWSLGSGMTGGHLIQHITTRFEHCNTSEFLIYTSAKFSKSGFHTIAKQTNNEELVALISTILQNKGLPQSASPQ